MTNKNYPPKLFCALPGCICLSRPDGNMRVCCIANALTVGATHDKKHGGQVGVLKTAEGVPANLNNPDLMTAWNNDYMKNVPSRCLTEKCPQVVLNVTKKKRQDI